MSTGPPQPPAPKGPDPAKMKAALTALQNAQKAQPTVLGGGGTGKAKKTQVASPRPQIISTPHPQPTQLEPPPPPTGSEHRERRAYNPSQQYGGPPPPEPPPPQRKVPSPGPPPPPPEPQGKSARAHAKQFAAYVDKLTAGVEGFTEVWDESNEGRDARAKEYSKKGEKFKEAGTRLVSSAQLAARPGGETRSFGEALGGAGALAGKLPEGVGKPVEAVMKFGKALLDAKDRLDKWSDALVDANFQFAQFSGPMAQAEAMHTVRQIQIEQFRGDQQADAANQLSEDRDRRESAESWWKAKWENFWTRVADVKENVEAGAVEWVNEKLGIPAPNKDLKGESEETMGRWLDRVGSGSWPSEYQKPQRFQ